MLTDLVLCLIRKRLNSRISKRDSENRDKTVASSRGFGQYANGTFFEIFTRDYFSGCIFALSRVCVWNTDVNGISDARFRKKGGRLDFACECICAFWIISDLDIGGRNFAEMDFLRQR